MTLKSLVPDEKKPDEEIESSSLPPPPVEKTQKPFTKRRAQSADEINAWGNTEIIAGAYGPDEKDVLRKAVAGKLKSEKLG